LVVALVIAEIALMLPALAPPSLVPGAPLAIPIAISAALVFASERKTSQTAPLHLDANKIFPVSQIHR
jgi:hypothetical protein